jgi:vacuolar-type H+-ATPase subunit F/Vma7
MDLTRVTAIGEEDKVAGFQQVGAVSRDELP